MKKMYQHIGKKIKWAVAWSFQTTEVHFYTKDVLTIIHLESGEWIQPCKRTT